MKRIKSILASLLTAAIIFTGFGFGIIAVGFAIVLGGASALVMRLAGPQIIAEPGKRAETAPDTVFDGQAASA